MNRRWPVHAAAGALAWAIAIACARNATGQGRYPPDAAPPARSSAPGPIRPQSHTAPIVGRESLDAQGADAPLAPRGPDGRLPISRPGDPKARPAGAASTEGAKAANPNSATQLVGVAGSLGVVLGLFLLVAWVMRRNLPASTKRLPAEVVEVLGHAPLAHRQQAQLLRLGNKLVLVSTSTGGAEPLGEVTDTAEVERLTALCRQASPPAAVTFRQVMRQLGEKRAAAHGAAGQIASAAGGPAKPATEVGHG